jgi:CBS domain-containing protein
MHVKSILKNKPGAVVTTRPNESVGATVKLLDANRIGAVLVLDEGERIVGIFSERDIVRGLARHGSGAVDLTVAQLMTRDVIACAPGDTLNEIMGVMTERRIRHLPVVEQGRLIGIISIGDVVKYRLEETQNEIDSLRDYVMTAH